MDRRSLPVLHYGWEDVNDAGLPPPYAAVTFEKYHVYEPWKDINELAALYYAKTGTASETTPYGDDSVVEECANDSNDAAITCVGVEDGNSLVAAVAGNNVNHAAIVPVSPPPPSPWMSSLEEDIELLLDNWSMPAPAEIPELPAPPAACRQRRRRDVWSEEEHLAFLRGLKANLKGDWKSIAKHFVPTKTTFQIASHAQKYFKRQESNRQNAATMKRKRRSIHDITTDHI